MAVIGHAKPVKVEVNPAGTPAMETVTAIDTYLDRFTAEMAVPENLRDAVRYALLGLSLIHI